MLPRARALLPAARVAARAKSTSSAVARGGPMRAPRHGGGGGGGLPVPRLGGGLFDFDPFAQAALAPVERAVGELLGGLRRVERDMFRVLELPRAVEVSVEVTPREYVLTSALPGVAAADLTVDVDEEARVLCIAAEKSAEGCSAPPLPPAAGAAAGGDAGAKVGDAGAAKDAAAGDAGAKDAAAADGGGAAARWHAERVYGFVERAIALPADADAERISAKLADGLLTLHVPRRGGGGGGSQEHGRRRVAVE